MTEDKPRLARGSVIKGYARYIKRKWGTDGVRQCQEDIGEVGFQVKDDAWYPEDVNQKILHWIADTHGIEYVEKAAEFTISEIGVIAYAARLAGIKKVLERGVEDYYRNFNYGDIDIQIEDNEAHISLTDATIDEIDCRSWIGAFNGILKITNKKGEVKKLECCHKDGEACKYIMTWD